MESCSDAGQDFEVSVATCRLKALAEGLGGGSFSIKLVPRESQVSKGDFITLASGFNKGLIIGQVSSAEKNGGEAFMNIEAVSLSDPKFLKYAFIIPQPQSK